MELYIKPYNINELFRFSTLRKDRQSSLCFFFLCLSGHLLWPWYPCSVINYRALYNLSESKNLSSNENICVKFWVYGTCFFTAISLISFCLLPSFFLFPCPSFISCVLCTLHMYYIYKVVWYNGGLDFFEKQEIPL